jgi:hypothetical protein
MWFAGLPSLSDAALLGWSAVSAGAAGGVWWLLSRRHLKPQWLLWAIVGLLIANLCWTVIDADRQAGFDQATGTVIPPLPATLDQSVLTSDFGPDARFYVTVLGKVRAGEDFYAAYSATLPEVAPTIEGPSGLLNVRFPTLYVAAAALPSAWWIIGAYLLLAGVSGAAVPVLLKGTVRSQLAIPGVAGVLSYAVLHATGAQILFTEVWAGLLTLLAFALLAASLRSSRWKALVVASALVALAAFAVREIAGFVLLAGLTASLVGTTEDARAQRAFRSITWVSASSAAVLLWIAHWLMARGYLNGAPGQSVLGQGSIEYLMAGLTYSTHAFSAVALVLAALGLVGIWLLSRRELVVFGLITVWLHLLSYLYVANSLENNAGEPVNYWSAAILFSIYACVPAVLSAIPGATVPRLAGANRGRGSDR